MLFEKNKMSRKGQIAILMLFVVAIVLVIASLVSFVNFPRDFGDRSILVSRAIAGVQAGEDYVVGISKIITKETISRKSDIPQTDFMEVANRKDYGVQEAGNFFGKIRNSDFEFSMISGEKYLLKIEGLFVQAEYGFNLIKRNFDLCMLFDKDGNYLGKSSNKEAYLANC